MSKIMGRPPGFWREATNPALDKLVDRVGGVGKLAELIPAGRRSVQRWAYEGVIPQSRTTRRRVNELCAEYGLKRAFPT